MPLPCYNFFYLYLRYCRVLFFEDILRFQFSRKLLRSKYMLQKRWCDRIQTKTYFNPIRLEVYNIQYSIVSYTTIYDIFILIEIIVTFEFLRLQQLPMILVKFLILHDRFCTRYFISKKTTKFHFSNILLIKNLFSNVI